MHSQNVTTIRVSLNLGVILSLCVLFIYRTGGEVGAHCLKTHPC